MFYRRKIILAVLQIFDGHLDKIRLQQLLFLLTMEQPKREYDFVPHKFGCFSYSADADLTTMIAKGQLQQSKDEYVKLDETDYLNLIKPDDLNRLQQVKTEYGDIDTYALMKHLWIRYPFYATRSEFAPELLDTHQLAEVESARPHNETTILFTIGYEGISLEEYLVRLLKNDVKVLVDVRSNPLSMKYGFSKSQLKKFCENLDIKYVHLPEVGIQSEQRQELNTQADYDRLFARYRSQTLTTTVEEQLNILELLKENRRIALTCFEADICQCHRKPLADAIGNLPGFGYRIVHL